MARSTRSTRKSTPAAKPTIEVTPTEVEEATAVVEEAIAEAMAATPDTDGVSDDETAPIEAKKTKKAKKTWEPLPEDRVEWIRKNARPAVAPCLCGCGGTTKGRFMPGHDATLKATLEANDDQVTLAAFGW